MSAQIHQNPGDVAECDGYVLIDGRGHPTATYTAAAAAALALKLGAAAELAAKTPVGQVGTTEGAEAGRTI